MWQAGGVTEAGRERRVGQAGRVDRGGPWKGIGLGRVGDRGRLIGLPSREGPHRVEPQGGLRGQGRLGAAEPQGPTPVKKPGVHRGRCRGARSLGSVVVGRRGAWPRNAGTRRADGSRRGRRCRRTESVEWRRRVRREGRVGDRSRPIGSSSREGPHRVEPGGCEGRRCRELRSRRGPHRLRNQGSTEAGAGGTKPRFRGGWKAWCVASQCRVAESRRRQEGSAV